MGYSILINTCDKFEDCWDPFFKLWSLYWPECKGKVYLNTEFKDYVFPGLNVIPVKGCEGKTYKGRFATWSQCLRWALEKIDTEIVLYMQEDYFLKDRVKDDLIESYVNLMQENKEIKCIHLTDQSVESCGSSEFANLDNVRRKQEYRVSCQAALWRKDELTSLIRDYESAWEFEEFGSQRSSVIGHRYLCVNHGFVRLGEFEILPYIFTGIIQGRWFEQTVPLFQQHGINVDWSRRGMLADAPKKPFIKRVEHRLKKIPKLFKNQITLLKLRKSSS